MMKMKKDWLRECCMRKPARGYLFVAVAQTYGNTQWCQRCNEAAQAEVGPIISFPCYLRRGAAIAEAGLLMVS